MAWAAGDESRVMSHGWMSRLHTGAKRASATDFPLRVVAVDEDRKERVEFGQLVPALPATDRDNNDKKRGLARRPLQTPDRPARSDNRRGTVLSRKSGKGGVDEGSSHRTCASS